MPWHYMQSILATKLYQTKWGCKIRNEMTFWKFNYCIVNMHRLLIWPHYIWWKNSNWVYVRGKNNFFLLLFWRSKRKFMCLLVKKGYNHIHPIQFGKNYDIHFVIYWETQNSILHLHLSSFRLIIFKNFDQIGADLCSKIKQMSHSQNFEFGTFYFSFFGGYKYRVHM